jgi:hypothetical protein
MVLMALTMVFVALWFAIRPSVSTRATQEAAATTAAPVTVTTPASPTTTTTKPPPPATTSAAAVHVAPPPTTSQAPAKVTVPAPVGWWKLDDGSGTTAADTMGANAGTESNVSWCGTLNCADFNGTNSQIVTPRAVLNTSPGNSFTVAAAVWLSSASSFATAVSQDGTTDSGFYLQYSAFAQRWAFSRVASDASNPVGIRAVATDPSPLKAWAYLTGVFDASDNQLRLYVNGKLEGTATDTTPFASDGDLVIGRAKYNGGAADWFLGAIGNVEVFNQALNAAQIAILATSGT